LNILRLDDHETLAVQTEEAAISAGGISLKVS
jgi:hypothetical protein